MRFCIACPCSFALAAVVVFLQAGCGKPACTQSTDCESGFVCVADTSSTVEGNICARACAADLKCPAGNACVPRDDGSFEGACLVATDTKKAGDACTSDRDCVTGACVGDGGAAVCVDECDLIAACANPADLCTLDGLRHVCVPPTDTKAPGDACSSSRECASGNCVVPPDQDQSQCATDCASEADCPGATDVCIRMTGGSRGCLEPLADGAVCQDNGACAGTFCITDVDNVNKCASACDNGTCAEGFSCETDLVSTNPVCMPVLDTRESGTACTQARECKSGHCAHFASDTQDFGTLCADPCDNGTCAVDLVCWSDPGGTDVCGPTPPP